MPHAWRRLLLCALLALAVHLLLLALFGPRLQARYTPAIAQPLVYTLEAAPAPAPRPAAATRRARTPRPVPALLPADSVAAPTAAPTPPDVPDAAPVAETATQASEPPVAASPELPPEPAAEATPAPAPLPGSVRLKYAIAGEVRGLTYQAGGELLWAHDGQDYEARLEVGAFLLGSRVQHSRGRITPQGLQALRFVDRTRRERVAELDHTLGQARFSEGAPPVPLGPEAQDQLSVFIQLASLFARPASAPASGSELALQVVGIREADTWRLRVGEEETLALPGGTLRTRKLSRQLEGARGLSVELWLAPELGWLPARIRLTQDNGDHIDQQWRGSEAP